MSGLTIRAGLPFLRHLAVHRKGIDPKRSFYTTPGTVTNYKVNIPNAINIDNYIEPVPKSLLQHIINRLRCPIAEQHERNIDRRLSESYTDKTLHPDTIQYLLNIASGRHSTEWVNNPMNKVPEIIKAKHPHAQPFNDSRNTKNQPFLIPKTCTLMFRQIAVWGDRAHFEQFLDELIKMKGMHIPDSSWTTCKEHYLHNHYGNVEQNKNRYGSQIFDLLSIGIGAPISGVTRHTSFELLVDNTEDPVGSEQEIFKPDNEDTESILLGYSRVHSLAVFIDLDSFYYLSRKIGKPITTIQEAFDAFRLLIQSDDETLLPTLPPII